MSERNGRPEGRGRLRFIPTAYAALCLAAILIFFLGLPAVAGSDSDPVAAIYAFILALPWVLALDLLPDVPYWLSIAGPIAGMIINYLILRRLVQRRR